MCDSVSTRDCASVGKRERLRERVTDDGGALVGEA